MDTSTRITSSACSRIQSGTVSPHPHAGDAEHRVVEALQVLHVHGGQDVDADVQEVKHVFPALRVFHSRHVGCVQARSTRQYSGRRFSNEGRSGLLELVATVGHWPPRDHGKSCHGAPWSPPVHGARSSPSTTSCPSRSRRLPSSSIWNVLPTPAAYPRYTRRRPGALPRCRDGLGSLGEGGTTSGGGRWERGESPGERPAVTAAGRSEATCTSMPSAPRITRPHRTPRERETARACGPSAP